MALENEIAILERQLSSAKTEGTKKLLSDKIGRLKVRLEDASSKGEARTKVAIARTKVKQMPLNKFKAYIKQLAKKPQYKFLKGLTTGQISDDKKRVAKPVGWRFSGRENMKKPTKAEIREGKKDGSVYYENRSIRSDVSRAIRLKTGGEVEDLTKLYNLENYVFSNLDEIKSNRKTYGFIDVSEITNPYDLSNLLGVDSRIFRNADIPFYADFISDLLENKEQMETGGGVGRERFNLSFNYNPSNVSNEDAEKIVNQYTNDWKHNNDFDNVSFYVFNLTKEKADELKALLKMEDVFNIEIQKSNYVKGGGVEVEEELKYVELSNGDIVVAIRKKDGQWHEADVLEGKEPYGWGGKTYMGYLKPKDIAQWLGKDYGGYFKIVDQYANGGGVGKLLGHTKTGKPIYNLPMTNPIYKDYTKQDRSDIITAFSKKYHDEELNKKISESNKMKTGGGVGESTKNILIEKLIDDNLDFRNDLYPYHRDEQLTEIAKKYGYIKDKNVANSLGYLMYFDLQSYFLGKYGGNTYKSGAKDWEFKTGGSTALSDNGDDYLGLVFSTDAQYKEGKKFYDGDSVFYADDFSDEFRTLFFKVEQNDSFDTLEFELERELQETDLDGWYFTQEEFMAGGKTRANRPSPSISATSVYAGSKERGNDGNIYQSRADKNGVQRWIRISAGEKKEKKSKSKVESKQKFLAKFLIRKASDWEEGDGTLNPEELEVLDSASDWLQTLPIHRFANDSPLDDFPASVKKEVKGNPFIAMIGKEAYYVDPQGYDYARYILNVTGFNNPKEKKSESNFKVGDRFEKTDNKEILKVTRIWDIKGVTYIEFDKNNSLPLEDFEVQLKNGYGKKVESESEHQEENNEDKIWEISRLTDLYIDGFSDGDKAKMKDAIKELTEYKDSYARHKDQTQKLFGKPYSFYTKEYTDAIEFLNALGGDKFAIGGTFKGGGNMNVENCERCNQPTGNATTMSMFNEDVICMSCKEKEKQHPDYKKAVDTDNAEIKKGNYNFKGIGKMGTGGTSDSAEDMGAPMIIGTMESSMETGGKTESFTKDAQGNYKNSAGYELIDQFDGTYQVLDPNGMDIAGEYETLEQGKDTIFGAMDVESDEMRKGGNVKSIEKRVAEANAMIKEATEKKLDVVDETGTWQSPMKYKPIKYSNGVLYVEYEELDLYLNNRKGVKSWVTKKDKTLKGDFGFNSSAIASAQTQVLTQIIRMYRKVLLNYSKYGYETGGTTTGSSGKKSGWSHKRKK